MILPRGSLVAALFALFLIPSAPTAEEGAPEADAPEAAAEEEKNGTGQDL